MVYASAAGAGCHGPSSRSDGEAADLLRAACSPNGRACSGSISIAMLGARKIRGWFFVLQEHPSEPRFRAGPTPSTHFGEQPAHVARSSAGIISRASEADLAKFSATSTSPRRFRRNPASADPTGAVWHAKRLDAESVGGSRAHHLSAEPQALRRARLDPHPSEAADAAVPGRFRRDARRALFPIALLPVRPGDAISPDRSSRCASFPDEIFADTPTRPGSRATSAPHGDAYVAAMANGCGCRARCVASNGRAAGRRRGAAYIARAPS